MCDSQPVLYEKTSRNSFACGSAFYYKPVFHDGFFQVSIAAWSTGTQQHRHVSGVFLEPAEEIPTSGMAPATQIKKTDLERPEPLRPVPHASTHFTDEVTEEGAECL